MTTTLSPTQMFCMTDSTTSSQTTLPVSSSLAVTALLPLTVRTSPAASLPATRQPGLRLETGRLTLSRHTSRELELEPGDQERQCRAAPLGPGWST